MGLLESLFGEDGIGGDPGPVMRGIYATPIAGQVASTIRDFTKDPGLFFGGSARGGLDLPALLSSDYRKQKAADMEAEREANKAIATAKGVQSATALIELLRESPTDTAQGLIRQGLVEQGLVDERLSKLFGAAAKSGRHEARQAGAQAGLLPEVSNLATPETARQAGQSQLTDRFRKEQIGAQGAETRANQANAFGYQIAGQNNSAANTQENIRLRDKLARKRLKQKGRLGGGATASERQGAADLQMLEQKLGSNQVPPNLVADAEAALTAGSGRQAYNLLTQMVQQQRVASPLQVQSDPVYKKAVEAAQAAEGTLLALDDVERAALTPDSAGIDPTLFSPAEAMFLPDDPGWQSTVLSMGGERGLRKQNLVSNAYKVVQKYILDMTGKVSNQKELERMQVVAPTGNEATGQLFKTKMESFRRAIERERNIALEEAQLRGQGLAEGDWRLNAVRDRREDSVRQLRSELEEAESDADNQDPSDLTPAEQAELARRGYDAQR